MSSLDEDIVFVQDNQILPSYVFSTEKNPPIRYTIAGISDIRALEDFDRETYIQIDPYDIASRDVVWTIDLGRVFQPHLMQASFDYSTESRVSFEVSED